MRCSILTGFIAWIFSMTLSVELLPRGRLWTYNNTFEPQHTLGETWHHWSRRIGNPAGSQQISDPGSPSWHLHFGVTARSMLGLVSEDLCLTWLCGHVCPCFELILLGVLVAPWWGCVFINRHLLAAIIEMKRIFWNPSSLSHIISIPETTPRHFPSFPFTTFPHCGCH